MAGVPLALLVDDNDREREGLAAIVCTCGYRVVACSSYEEACSLLTDERPDVLITDVRLGGRNGLQLARVVGERFPEVTRIVLTAFDDIAVRREAATIGARFLLKPLKAPELEAVLAAVNVTAPVPRPSRNK
jgi:YesN/AraC family two-component response regulator